MARHAALLLTVFLAILTAGKALAFDPLKVSFERPDGRVLSGYLSLPDIVPPHPAIVFLHGCSGLGVAGSLRPHYSSWMRLLGSRGFAVLAIDSLAPRGFPTGCLRGPHRRRLYAERPGDAYAGLLYLQARGDIDTARVGLMGWSQGGGIVLLTVNTESIGRPVPAPAHDFRAAVALYPSACNDRFQSKPFTKVEVGTWKTIAPLLVLHGAADNWTRPGPCKRFVERAARRGEPMEIILYDKAVHAFDAPNVKMHRRHGPRLADGSLPLIGTDRAARQAAMKRVPAFFEEHLGRPD